MTNPKGSFIWYELMTSDPDGAARFYGAFRGDRYAQVREPFGPLWSIGTPLKGDGQ